MRWPWLVGEPLERGLWVLGQTVLESQKTETSWDSEKLAHEDTQTVLWDPLKKALRRALLDAWGPRRERRLRLRLKPRPTETSSEASQKLRLKRKRHFPAVGESQPESGWRYHVSSLYEKPTRSLGKRSSKASQKLLGRRPAQPRRGAGTPPTPQRCCLHFA